MSWGTSFAWGTRGHYTTVTIAEKHLTPKAKKLLNKYLHGKSIVDYASWADEFKKELTFELDFEPTNAPRVLRYPHTFVVNANNSVFGGDRRGNEWVKNCVYMADGYIKELMNNHAKMDDELRLHKIAMLISARSVQVSFRPWSQDSKRMPSRIGLGERTASARLTTDRLEFRSLVSQEKRISSTSME